MCELCKAGKNHPLRIKAALMDVLNDTWRHEGHAVPKVGEYITVEKRHGGNIAPYSLREGFSYQVISIEGDPVKMDLPEKVKELLRAAGTQHVRVPDNCIEVLDDNGKPFMLPFPISLIGFISIVEVTSLEA